MKARRARTEMKASRARTEMKKPRSRVPHAFVLDALEPIGPVTRPMFGCLAVYVKEKIVLILRDHRDHPADNGVWLATTAEHHDSLRRHFPHIRSIQLFSMPVTNRQVLPADASDFEEAALHACELVLARDPRIGKVPGRRTVTRKTGTAQKMTRTSKRKTKTPMKKR